MVTGDMREDGDRRPPDGLDEVLVGLPGSIARGACGKQGVDVVWGSVDPICEFEEAVVDIFVDTQRHGSMCVVSNTFCKADEVDEAWRIPDLGGTDARFFHRRLRTPWRGTSRGTRMSWISRASVPKALRYWSKRG